MYCTEEGKKDYVSRCETVERLKMSIQQIHKDVVDANSILEKMLGNIKKTELAEEVISDRAIVLLFPYVFISKVSTMSQELQLLKNMEDKLQSIKDFNSCFASHQESIR